MEGKERDVGRLRWSLDADENARVLNTFFGLATTIFGDATRAFAAEAYVGTSLLCRSSLEAAFYMFPTRSMDRELGSWLVSPPTKMDEKRREIRFEEIKKAMKQSIRKWGVLPDKLRDAIDRIHENGNLGAHLATTQDKVVWFQRDRRRPKGRPRFWVDEETAWKDLTDTAAILKRLAYVIDEIPEWAGPPPLQRVRRLETYGWSGPSGRERSSGARD